MGKKSPRVYTSSYAGAIRALFYGFDMARMLKILLSELTFANIGVSIPTYVRSDNSDAVRQVDSVNTATNGKRLNGFLESNRGGELEKNGLLSVGYIPGVMDTSDGLTKSMSSANMRNLLTRNTMRIVTEEKKKEIRKKMPAPKHYIVHPGTIQGGKYMDFDARR